MTNLHNNINPHIQEMINSIIDVPNVLNETGSFKYVNRRSTILDIMQDTQDKDNDEVMGIMDTVNSLIALADLLGDHSFSKTLINVVSSYLQTLNVFQSYTEISSDLVKVTNNIKSYVREAKMSTVNNMHISTQDYTVLITDKEYDLLTQYHEQCEQGVLREAKDILFWMLISISISKDLRSTYDIAQGVDTDTVRYESLMDSRQLLTQILFNVHFIGASYNYIEDIIDLRDVRDPYTTLRELEEIAEDIESNL